MARNSRSVRLVLALSVAGVLAIFLLYVSIAGGRTPQLAPSQVAGHKGQISLVGRVVGPVHGAGYSTGGLRFAVADIGKSSKGAIPVVYHGSVPDLFKVDRHIVVDGTYRNGVFVAKHDTLVTKCPSKYTPKA
ncbi:MAG TPA: cytochrome c maturation protein CcmE [Gaiellaceae bacterium]